MKKVIIACAAVLALGMMSCGDTKMCYKVSAINAEGQEILTTYMYGTSKDIDASIEQWKKLTLSSLVMVKELRLLVRNSQT